MIATACFCFFTFGPLSEPLRSVPAFHFDITSSQGIRLSYRHFGHDSIDYRGNTRTAPGETFCRTICFSSLWNLLIIRCRDTPPT